jgi:hypothetical protein
MRAMRHAFASSGAGTGVPSAIEEHRNARSHTRGSSSSETMATSSAHSSTATSRRRTPTSGLRRFGGEPAGRSSRSSPAESQASREMGAGRSDRASTRVSASLSNVLGRRRGRRTLGAIPPEANGFDRARRLINARNEEATVRNRGSAVSTSRATPRPFGSRASRRAGAKKVTPWRSARSFRRYATHRVR